MFGYAAFEALKKALIDFLYSPGDILPYDQANGVERLDYLLDGFKAEVDVTLLNHKDKKVNRYFDDLWERASRLDSLFDDLFLPLLTYPDADQLTNQALCDQDGNVSGNLALTAITNQLLLDGTLLESSWLAKTNNGTNQEESSAFFHSMIPWERVAFRYKFVQNIMLAIIEYIADKKPIWSVKTSTNIELMSSIHPSESNNEGAKMIWNLEVQQFAELLYMAEKKGALNLKDLLEQKHLPKALQQLCEGIHFTKSKVPAKSLYNILIKMKPHQLGPGKPDYPTPKHPWGQQFKDLFN